MTADSGQPTKRISKLVGGVLGVVVLAVAGAYMLRLARLERSSPVPESLPKDVNQQVSGYTFTRSEGGRQIFTLRAARTVAFKDRGKMLLIDVSVEVFGRTAARHDLLKTQQCDYDPQAGGLSCLGKVEIQLNAKGAAAPGSGLRGRQPLYLETSGVRYQPQESLVLGEEPVRFRYGPASGSAVGIRYATKDGWVELEKDVVTNLPASGGITLPIRVTAAALSYEKVKGQVALSGPLEITQGSRRVQAAQGSIFLDQQNRIVQAVLQSGAQGSDSSGGGSLAAKAETMKADFDPVTGELRTLTADGDVSVENRARTSSLNRLSAQHVDISFMSGYSRSAQPSGAHASGNVKLSSESRPASRSRGAAPGAAATVASAGGTACERKELAASEVQFKFYPGGQDLREARTIGPGELVILSSDLKQGRRVITAGQFLMGFDGRGHPESLRGLSGTKVVVEPAANKPAGVLQESWSDELDARFDAATQELVTLEQAGNFQFREGDRQAEAERASYSGQDHTLKLIGSPMLWDTETRIRAGQFTINLRSGTADGSDGVQSTHFGAANAVLLTPSRPAAQDAHGQTSEEVGATTNVLADSVRAERESQFVRYEGHVRAWNGYDVVESPSLEIYRKQRRIVSGSNVLTSHLQPALTRSNSSPPASNAIGVGLRGASPVTVRADRLEYLDEGREASYRGHVRVDTANTTLQSENVDVYFSPLPAGPGKAAGAAQIERVVATGHVTVTQPTRRASGERAEYFTGPGKVVMTGGPPVLYDEQNGFTTGQSLTFFVHDDSLLVVGGDQLTLSKRHLAR